MPLVSRSRFLWVVAAVVVVAGLWLGVRFWLGGYMVQTVLSMAGGTEITYGLVRGTPWRLQVEELRFRIFEHEVSAQRVTLEREKWWMASLGNVRVEGARLPVTLDGSDFDPWNWSAGGDEGLGDEPVNLPFQSLVLDGELVVRMAMLPEIPIKVRLDATPKSGSSWMGNLVAEGVGFRLAGGGSLLRAGQELDFQVLSSELDLETWSQHIQRLVILPGRPWKMSGKLSGVGDGKVTAKRFAATARINLRDGRMRVGTRDIAAEGAEAELEFSDLWKFRTKSGFLRVNEVRVGRLLLEDVAVDFGLWGGQTLLVNEATFAALGGVARVKPFRYQLDRREVSATVDVENLDLSQVLGLTTEQTAEPTGRIDGTLPMRIEATGVRLERGYLSLRPGSEAEMKVNTTRLLRSGAVMSDSTMGILRSATGKTTKLSLGQLRLDIRAPDLPLGSSARLSVEGEIAEGPVLFSLQVNGSVEKHLSILP